MALNAQNALNALKESILKAEVEGLVDDAVKAGKVAPATKDFYVGLCMQEGGAEKFKEFLAKQPVVVAPGSEDATGAPASSVALNAETKKWLACWVFLRKTSRNTAQWLRNSTHHI